MNTFKLAAFSIVSVISFNAVDLHANTRITGASYGVYAQSKSAVEPKVGNIEFYTFDGNLIAVLQNDNTFNFIVSKLDKNAPKPQPVNYKMIYRNNKGYKGYWAVFYDKNGNVIGECRCHDEYSSPSLYAPDYDLSVIKRVN